MHWFKQNYFAQCTMHILWSQILSKENCHRNEILAINVRLNFQNMNLQIILEQQADNCKERNISHTKQQTYRYY